MMPDAFLASLEPSVRAVRWRGPLQRVASDTKIFVAIDQEAVVGFAGIGPARGEVDSRGELYMINVAPRAWGTGVAALLLEHAMRTLVELGHGEAILWVLRANVRARRFYERAGWTENGERRDEITENGFTFDVDELRYARVLSLTAGLSSP